MMEHSGCVGGGVDFGMWILAQMLKVCVTSNELP